MEELIAVKGERYVLDAILKDIEDRPNTRPWVCDGSTPMLTSNEIGLLRSTVKRVADPQWPP